MASNIHRSPTLHQPSKTSIASQVSSLKSPSWGVQRWDPTRAHSHSWLFLSSPGGWSDFITAVSHGIMGHFFEWLSNPLRNGSCKSQDWVIPVCWLDSMSDQQQQRLSFWLPGWHVSIQQLGCYSQPQFDGASFGWMYPYVTGALSIEKL